MNRERRKIIEKAKELVDEARAMLDQAREEEEAAKDALPESLQDGAPGQKMDEHIETLQELADELENLDFDQFGAGA